MAHEKTRTREVCELIELHGPSFAASFIRPLEDRYRRYGGWRSSPGVERGSRKSVRKGGFWEGNEVWHVAVVKHDRGVHRI